MRGKKAKLIRRIARNKIAKVKEKANRDLDQTIYQPGSPTKLGYCTRQLYQNLKKHYFTLKHQK